MLAKEIVDIASPTAAQHQVRGCLDELDGQAEDHPAGSVVRTGIQFNFSDQAAWFPAEPSAMRNGERVNRSTTAR